MKDKLLKIINYYGVDNQQRKLEEEVFELQQAINTYELQKNKIPLSELIAIKEHLEEEVGDVLNVLEQFVYKYELDRQRIVISRITKIDRTLGDVENEDN